MICPSCGAHNSDSATFCTLCLARFSEPERATPSGPVPHPVRATSVNEWAGKKRAYCMTELKANDDVLLCGACEMPHHQDCWNENGGCATFGCLAADQGSAMVSASPRHGVDGLTMLVATFGPTTGWLGRTIIREGDAFILEGHGPISAEAIMGYDRQGHLVWAADGMRAWVESKAGAPQAAREGPSVIAAFAATTGWSGKVITFESEVFTLQDYGPITASDVLTYDRQGQLVWAEGGMRAWVESKASAPQVATVATSLASGSAKPAASAGVATVAVGKGAEATQASFTDGGSAAKTKADSALGSPEESTPAVGPVLAAEPMPVVEESAAPVATSVDVPVMSIADEIAKLAELHAKGILTDDEFAAVKGRLLK